MMAGSAEIIMLCEMHAAPVPSIMMPRIRWRMCAENAAAGSPSDVLSPLRSICPSSLAMALS